MSKPGLRETKEQTRLAIARAGLALFFERGFESVSIAEIAAAAKVSKMTVFNYFPSKEDIFFEFTHGTLPDLAAAIRERQDGVRPVAAIHRLARAELERHAEWTGLHDGVAKFARVIFESPTLVRGFDRLWRTVESDLTSALADAQGIDAPPPDIVEQISASLALERDGTAARVPRADILASLTTDQVRIRLVAAQVLAVLQNLVAVNMLRQVLGQSAAQTEGAALRECDEAFSSLSDGLAAQGF